MVKNDINSFNSLSSGISQSGLLLLDLFNFFNLDVKKLSPNKYKQFCSLCKINSNYIKNVLDNVNLISNLIGVNEVNVNVIVFFVELSQIGLFYDFFDVIDEFSAYNCDLDCLKLIKSINFKKIKKFKSILKKRYPSLKLDINAIKTLNLVKSFDFIWDSPLLMCIEEKNASGGSKNSSFIFNGVENPDYFNSVLNNYSILNYKNFDYVFLRRIWENKYTFGSSMFDSSEFLIWLAFKKLFNLLPNWANIIEDWTLSWDSFPLLLNLYKKQQQFNLKVSIPYKKCRLNLLWKKSKLSELILKKNIWNLNIPKYWKSLFLPSNTENKSFLSFCNSLKSRFLSLFSDEPDSPIFETIREYDAWMIADEFNKMIADIWLSWIKHLSARAECIEWGNKWWVRLPSFKIVKKSSI